MAILVSLMWAGVAAGATYSGQLVFNPSPSGVDGVVAGGDKWSGYASTFSWTVSDTDASHPGFAWKYEYEFKVNGTQSAISHLILETSESFDARQDMIALTGAKLEDFGRQAVTSGNPNMPSDLWGLRFIPTGETHDLKWSFYSKRAPVWGDFYAKAGGGKKSPDTARNAGFTALDIDPTSPLANGSTGFHILRPDTTTGEYNGGVVPLPSSLLAGGALLGILAVGRLLNQARKARE